MMKKKTMKGKQKERKKSYQDKRERGREKQKKKNKKILAQEEPKLTQCENATRRMRM